MALRTGIPLLFQQYTALLNKNFLLSWRHKAATIAQLFSSLFFIFLIFLIEKATQSLTSATTSFRTVTDPGPLLFPPIPPCEDKFYVKPPCFDFVWSGNESARLQKIVGRIMANNPGRPIPQDKVKSFKTINDTEQWLFSEPMHCPAALHFIERNATVISYGVQTNSTPVRKRGHYEDPTFKFQIPLQIAAEREISRSMIGDKNFNWVIGFKEFAHPPKTAFSGVAKMGPTFFLAIAMFGFVFQLMNLVTEKELKLRQAMTMMGLYDTAYWLSWLTWEGFITIFASLFTVLFGMMFQFRFFLRNSFVVVFLVFFLFQLNMITYAFMWSTFLSKASSSTTLGFTIFIVGFLTQYGASAGIPYTPTIKVFWQVIWSLFPPNLLNRALKLLADATSSPDAAGISWSTRAECVPAYLPCVMTINDVFIWLLATFGAWFFLAIYLDNIIPNAAGVRKPVYYFLNPGYWLGTGGNKVVEGGICSCLGEIPLLEPVAPDDVDVLEEENIVKQQAVQGVDDPSVAVSIRGLVKTYAGTRTCKCTCKCGCCCGCKSTNPYHAVKGLWMNFAKDQLFCLLGPNGAGKTTTISCLTGISPVTDGDALIYGYSVRSSVEMANIRKIIGVCPQFDILWDSLSGEEHLHLFAKIKGLPPATIKAVAEKALAEVKLTRSAKQRAGSYSGGMKRRVSVAVALIGDPKFVIFDEPTTGMDPITRRHVWDVIEEAKKGRSIVLTTHSMEEADVLSDRIGIVAKGRLRCIGTSIRLKSRFGTGFIANVSFTGKGDAISTPHYESVKEFFKNHLGVEPKEENRNFLTFVIPHDKERILTNFFAELQDREREFCIADIQLGLTTLEEVFLNIAKQAELESAAAEGRSTNLILDSGIIIEVPVGARFVGVPGTESPHNPQGDMVEVFWDQDDSGKLVISGHSPQTPVPPNVQMMSSAAGNYLSMTGTVHGITS